MNNLLGSKRGTSLVEILVVMVVLLVGILIVIQMFPIGFRVVRAAESQTIATKLGQAEVERWKNMPDNLPDGILPIAGNGVVLNDQFPGPPFEVMTPSSTSGQYDLGNVLNIRWVRNETTRIPTASYFQSGMGAVFGSRYNLAFSPIEVTQDANNPGLYEGLSIKSGDLRRRKGESDTPPPYMKQGEYAIDYTVTPAHTGATFFVAFPDRNTSHAYKLSYSYWVSDSEGNRVLLSQLDQDIHPKADGDWQEVRIDPPSPYETWNIDEIEANTDTCARGFTQVASGASWGDPYEFALVDSILGVIAFNPAAKNLYEYTARGVRPITARIDYRIYDPRIIREERVVPDLNEHRDIPGDSSSPTTLNSTAVKLALRFILNAGNPTNLTDGDPTDNPDEPTFEGLIRKQLGKQAKTAADLAVSQSVLIIDLATGLRVDMTDVIIDFSAGVVHLPEKADLIDWQSNPVSSFEDTKLKGRHLRFFYRADGDWSIQCSKAYSLYTRKYAGERVDYNHFKVIGDADKGYKLLFAQCDSAKSVSVDYSYFTTANNEEIERRIVGRNMKISDDWITDPDDSTVKCAYVNLTVPPGAKIRSDSRILVVGVSFKARVIWRDATHWRYVDVDTNLTRNSAQ